MTALVAAVVGGVLLVRTSPTGPVLPEAATAGDGPDPDQLAAVWGATWARALAPAQQVAEDPAVVVHLVALDRAPVWAGRLPTEELHRLAHPAAVTDALRSELAVLDGSAPWPARRPDWYRPGWWDAFDAWVDESLADAGLRRRAASRTVRVWGLSAVLEVPVQGGSVFAKAVSDLFNAEPTITSWLGRLVPGRVPAVIATEPSRGWMLMRAFHGGPADTRPDAAPEAARVLAGVQLASVERSAELLACGAPDRTSGPTLAMFASVARAGVDLALLSDDERSRVASLPRWLAGRLDALDALGQPPTVVHGDLHLGNVAANDQKGALLFDWTDAALAHPVLDAVMLAMSASRTDPTLGPATLDAWAGTWRTARPDVDLDAVIALGLTLHWAYQAVSYDAIARSQEGRGSGELVGLSARCLRELLTLRDRGDGRDDRHPLST